MGAAAAFRDGLRRVNGAPVVVAGLCLVTLLVALPLSIALRGMIAAQLGASLVAERVAAGGDQQWWQEFLFQSSGLGSTFRPTIVGFGAVLHNLSGFLDNRPLAATIVGATIAWMVIWSFLSGAVIDRLARNRPTRAAGFFAAAGTHFWRFLRLGVFAVLVYLALFDWLHVWIFDGLFAEATLDVSGERTGLVLRLAAYAAFGAALVFFNVVFDYARIRIVVEDRRSALAAVVAAVRFIRRHPGRVSALYFLNGFAFILLIASYALLTLVVPRSGAMMWLALLLGQAYIVARHYLKLTFYASETALFQSHLGHAEYTAAPVLEWPESPAAEAIIHADPAAP
jgi:hypothetical protein